MSVLARPVCMTLCKGGRALQLQAKMEICWSFFKTLISSKLELDLKTSRYCSETIFLFMIVYTYVVWLLKVEISLKQVNL